MSTSGKSAGREYRAYVLAGDPLAGTPDIWVAFTFNDDTVTIIGVNAVPAVLETDVPEPNDPDPGTG